MNTIRDIVLNLTTLVWMAVEPHPSNLKLVCFLIRLKVKFVENNVKILTIDHRFNEVLKNIEDWIIMNTI